LKPFTNRSISLSSISQPTTCGTTHSRNCEKYGILHFGFHGLRQKAVRILRSVFRVSFVLLPHHSCETAGAATKQPACQQAQKEGRPIKMSGRQQSPAVGGEAVFLAYHTDSHKEHAAGQILGAAAAVPSDKGK